MQTLQVWDCCQICGWFGMHWKTAKFYFPKNQCISSLLLKLVPFQNAEEYKTIQHSNLTYKQQKNSVCICSQLRSLNVLICRPALRVWGERWPIAQLYPRWSHWKESGFIGLWALDRGPELWRYPEKTSVDFRSVPLLPHMERRPRASLGL